MFLSFLCGKLTDVCNDDASSGIRHERPQYNFVRQCRVVQKSESCPLRRFIEFWKVWRSIPPTLLCNVGYSFARAPIAARILQNAKSRHNAIDLLDACDVLEMYFSLEMTVKFHIHTAGSSQTIYAHHANLKNVLKVIIVRPDMIQARFYKTCGFQ